MRKDDVSKPADTTLRQLENVSNAAVANVAKVAFDVSHDQVVRKLESLGARVLAHGEMVNVSLDSRWKGDRNLLPLLKQSARACST